MSLFGKSLYQNSMQRKIKINFNFTDKVDKEKSLLEMAKERFGNDKRLMLEIELFLSQRRKAHQNPSRIAWGEQLKLLAEYPEEERLAQVMRSIRNDYRSIAYEIKYKKPDISIEKSKDEDIRYDLGI